MLDGGGTMERETTITTMQIEEKETKQLQPSALLLWTEAIKYELNEAKTAIETRNYKCWNVFVCECFAAPVHSVSYWNNKKRNLTRTPSAEEIKRRNIRNGKSRNGIKMSQVTLCVFSSYFCTRRLPKCWPSTLNTFEHAIKSVQEKKKKGKTQIGIEALATEKTCTVHSIAKYDEICALFLFRFEKGIPKVVGDNFFPRTNSKSNKRKTACALVYRKQNMYIFDNVR